MTKQPFQMKNLIDEWAKQWGYVVNDITKNQGKAPIEWMLEVTNGTYTVAIYTQKNSDLLRLQSLINFSDEHKQQTGMMQNVEFNAFVLNMTDRLANYGCDWMFDHDKSNPKQMNSLTLMYFMVYDNADKNAVLQLINKAFINQSQMIRAISLTLNKSGEPQGTSMQDNNKKSMYG